MCGVIRRSALSPNRTHEINLAPSLGDFAPGLFLRRDFVVLCQVTAFPFQQNSVSFFQSVSISTAIFRAVATAAFLKPLRPASRTAHDFNGENRLTSRIRQVAGAVRLMRTGLCKDNMTALYAALSWRHSARAAVRFSLKLALL